MDLPKEGVYLTWKAYFTMFITLNSLFALILQRPPDVTLLFATLLLRIAGVLDDRGAYGGFSNGVVLSVAVLGVVSAGVHHTGVVEFMLMGVLGKPRHYSIALIRLLAPTFCLNVCVSNTCVMGCLIPLIEKWCKDIPLHPAWFLMPVSYLVLIQGTFAIFSTSSNLIAQGLIQDQINKGKLPTNMLYSTFEVAGIAMATAIGGMIYAMIFVPIILGRFRPVSDDSPSPVASPEAGALASTVRKTRQDM
jgi:hypothetical protein